MHPIFPCWLSLKGSDPYPKRKEKRAPLGNREMVAVLLVSLLLGEDDQALLDCLTHAGSVFGNFREIMRLI